MTNKKYDYVPVHKLGDKLKNIYIDFYYDSFYLNYKNLKRPDFPLRILKIDTSKNTFNILYENLEHLQKHLNSGKCTPTSDNIDELITMYNGIYVHLLLKDDKITIIVDRTIHITINENSLNITKGEVF